MFNSHGTRLLCPTRNEMSVLPRHFIIGVFDAYRFELTGFMYYLRQKIDSWSKKCHFRSIFGSFPVTFPSKNFFGGNFYSTKRFVFKFQGESLELFLSYHAQFRRYEHFRGFWQSTASSFRSC